MFKSLNNNSFKFLFVLIISFIFIQTGCSCSSDGGGQNSGPALKSLNLAIPSDMTTSDPALSTDVNSGQILSKIYERLLNFDDNLNLTPDLAETFEVSADCTEFKFVLKKNVKFSDGKTLLTPKAVKESFERVMNPKTMSPKANIFDKLVGYEEFLAGKSDNVSGISISGEYEVKLKIKQPFSPFLFNLTMVPASIVSVQGTDILGTGPFFISQKSNGAKMTLKKNVNYYQADKVFIDEIIYKIIHDEKTQISEFQIGNLDVLNLSTVNVKNFLSANASKFNIHQQPKLNSYYIAFNAGKNLFSEKIRKAMNYAINKDEIIKALMNGTMVSSKGPFPPTLNSFDPAATGYSYDPEKAKQLLKEENAQNLKFDLYFKSSQEIEDIMVLIKEDLKKVGIDVTLKKMEWAALKSEIVKGNLAMYYLNWSADYPDAHNFLVPLFHSKNKGAGGNRAFFEDKALDVEMDKLETTSSDSEYKKLARSIQNNVIEKAPWIFLWHEIEYAASQKNIENYNVPKIYSMEKFIGLKLKN